MSDPWFQFHPIFSPILVAMVFLVLTPLLIGLEWKRNLRFRQGRIIAMVMVMLSLAGLLFRPAIKQKKSHANIMLITTHYSQQAADSLIKQYPDLKIIQTPDSKRFNNAEILPSFHALSSLQQDIRFVLGDGLPLHALDLLDKKDFEYIAGPLHEGITDLITPLVVSNTPALIQGTYTNHHKFSTLILKGPAGLEDSVQVRNGINLPFTITCTPKHAGNFLYQLQLKDSSGNVLEQNPLPITVQEKKQLSILFLQHFPTAETRYLKNFLTEQNHSITVRYQLSKGTYRYEFANSSPRQADKINTALLDACDLVILDTDVFQSLSSVEKNNLKKSIDQGLGVVFLFNDLPSKIKELKLLLPVSVTKTQQDTTFLRINGDAYLFPATPESFFPDQNIQSVLESKSGSPIAGYVHHRFGKVGFQLLQETYPLLLQGKKEAYAMMWVPLFTQVTRHKKADFQLNIVTPGPLQPNEPVDIEIISSGRQPTLLANNIRIPLIEDVMLDDRWFGRTWFETSGWHSLVIPEDSSLHQLYVFNPGEWETWQVTEQVKKNKVSQQNSSDPLAETVFFLKPLSTWYFFILLVCAAGFLWLAPKL